MALTRKVLAALGIEDEKVNEIIQAHTETVNGLKDEIEKYKADAEKLSFVTNERIEKLNCMGQEPIHLAECTSILDPFSGRGPICGYNFQRYF